MKNVNVICINSMQTFRTCLWLFMQIYEANQTYGMGRKPWIRTSHCTKCLKFSQRITKKRKTWNFFFIAACLNENSLTGSPSWVWKMSQCTGTEMNSFVSSSRFEPHANNAFNTTESINACRKHHRIVCIEDILFEACKKLQIFY